MDFPEISVSKGDALGLEVFREMDYFAVENYGLPIELMMENAGLNLARLVAKFSPNINAKILIGVGPGNNGGGGLVAARRLAGWGYCVHIDLLTENLTDLPSIQLSRALQFGVKRDELRNPDVIVDAYLGFSQRPPLRNNLLNKIKELNNMEGYKISLDLPTGLFDPGEEVFFNPDAILTLAAPKKVHFYSELKNAQLFLSDLGIPRQVYEKYGLESQFDFTQSTILRLDRQ